MGNVIADKSFDFAIKIVRLSKKLRESKDYELASQILKSGTSIGANIAEAQKAQSKKDFLAKMYIALKEANETIFWLRLLYATDILDTETFGELSRDIHEIERILNSITKSTAQRLKDEKPKP